MGRATRGERRTRLASCYISWTKRETDYRQRTVSLHDGQELDNDLGARSDHDLALAGLLGVVDVLESIVQDGSADHLE